MLLKSLEVQGFKTFPDKTKLTFDKGITSIVGPNGSGKSNISDAIRWVLGEQSPKSLRCSKMEDVVFNGTDKRKKVGYAQVTLTIENKDRILPFDHDDVAVTRRYYRSGDSEYMINKAMVRLKDIHELFMDTGLGRDGYSMIGQGKIDSIVAAKSDERREIFEEAAGISRYRYRKIEAERKLKGTEENLVRLKDVVSELEQRVGPLEIQSKKAQAFLEYSSEKKELEIGIWLDTLEKSSTVLNDNEEKLSVATSQNNDLIEDLENINNQIEEFYLNRIDDTRNEISKHEDEISEKKATISVNENNILHNSENIKRIKGEIDALSSNKSNLDKETKLKKEKLQNVLDNLQRLFEKQKEYNVNLEKIETELKEHNTLINIKNIEIEKLKEEINELKVSQLTSSSSALEAQNRVATLSISIDEKTALIKKFNDNKVILENDINLISSNLSKVNETLNNLISKTEEDIKKANILKSQGDKLSLDASERMRRKKILEDLENNLEGFNFSVKTVMKHSKNGTLQGIHGPLSRVIKVPSEYTVAIEIALGASMQNIVVDDEQSAKKAIEFLKRQDGGRATFLPLTTIKGTQLNENEFKNVEGVIGVASTLCKSDEKYKGILYSSLGRIVVAKDLNYATAIAKRFNYKYRIVTLDGQVVNAGGSLTGGSLAKKSGLLSRVSEIEKNEKLAIEISQKAKSVLSEFENLSKEININQDEIKKLNISKNEISENEIMKKAELKSLINNLENINKSLEVESKEKENYTQKQLAHDTISANAKEKTQNLQDEISVKEKEVNSLATVKNSLSDKKENISNNIQNIKFEIVTNEKDSEILSNEITSANSFEQQQKIRKDFFLAEIETYTNKNSEIEKETNELKDFILKANQNIEFCSKKLEQFKNEHESFEKRNVELRKLEKEKTSQKEIISRELAKLEERKINLQKQYDEIITKLWEEYELTRREADEVAKPIKNLTEGKRRLNELKNKIKNLGSVNVGAIEEYKEVSERFSFMTKQIADVVKSKNEILRLINDLTTQMKDIFHERFNEINKNFKETFVQMFGGGKAYLELTDPSDMLQSGIDIVVHPPGKIVVHLQSLSGGEKALVAIALYFAIMKVRPAPFCVMDEIEAALDEVNVSRFASYLRYINDKTQFILITHRRGTMEEADVLYGVTMQDRGISKLLELKASQVAKELNMQI